MAYSQRPDYLEDIFEAECAKQEDDRASKQTTERYSVDALELCRSMVTVRHAQEANDKQLQERPSPDFGK
jgi:hypothetical protein